MRTVPRVSVSVALAVLALVVLQGQTPKTFRVWVFSDAHTHTNLDDTYGGKSHIERRWGTTFVNVAGLTRYHTAPEDTIPRSWLLTFTDRSDEVTALCYLHGNEHAPQGWYARADRVIELSKPFQMPAGR